MNTDRSYTRKWQSVITKKEIQLLKEFRDTFGGNERGRYTISTALEELIKYIEEHPDEKFYHPEKKIRFQLKFKPGHLERMKAEAARRKIPTIRLILGAAKKMLNKSLY